MKYDIAIIGAGPGGYSAAFKAASQGLQVVLFEQDRFGGTCLNRGCIPTKALLASALRYSDLKNAEKFGIGADALRYDMAAIVSRRDQVVDRLRTDLGKAVKAHKITLVNGHAQIIANQRVRCNGECYEAENIVIASGSKVAIPPIAGIESAAVLTSNQLLEKDDIDFPSLTIIGAGVIGVECASIYLALGKPVTMIEMADHILPTMDPEIGQRLTMHLKKRGAKIVTGARVTEIDGHTVRYLDKKGTVCESTSAAILVATGRKANLDDLFGADLQPQIQRGIVTDQQGRTSLEHVYAIGDAVSGNIQLAHVAMAQGENVIDVIMQRPPQIDMRTVPSCLYTCPEAASVGLYEQQAKEAGLSVHCVKSLTGANGKSVIEDADAGYVKLVLDDQQVIVGAQMVCPHATELIGETALAVAHRLTVDQLRQVIHAHPTVNEMIAQAGK